MTTSDTTSAVNVAAEQLSVPSCQSVEFPLDESGNRSTTALAKDVLFAAFEAIEPGRGSVVSAVKQWRKDYIGPFVEHMRVGELDSGEYLRSCQAGLDALHSSMVAVCDGIDIPLSEYLDTVKSEFELDYEVINGSADEPSVDGIPTEDGLLTGDDALAQLDDWLARDIIEPSAHQALQQVIQNPQARKLEGRAVLVLGAGSELGPTKALLAGGATVLAIDLPVSTGWANLREFARQSAGTLIIPTRTVDSAVAWGADLLAELPAIAQWVQRVVHDINSAVIPSDHDQVSLTLGTYLYADGGVHVRLTAAADALATYLITKNVVNALAFLATPTDAFVVPADAVAVSAGKYAKAVRQRSLHNALRLVSLRKLYTPNYFAGSRVHDSMQTQQGPNYSLAKRAQRWRAAVAHSQGVTVSINVAPSTATQSVLKNKALATVYKAADTFDMEIFRPDTASYVMGSMLVADLVFPAENVETFDQLEAHGAITGGLWRSAFKTASIMPVAGVLGLLRR